MEAGEHSERGESELKEETKKKMTMAVKDNNNIKPPVECQEHFRLFSYLAMAILTIAILVGLFLVVQHLSEEQSAEQNLANQETLLQNQRLLLTLNQNQTNALDISMKNQKNLVELIKITNQNNTEFFKILDAMTAAETDEFHEINAVNEKLDKIIKYLNITTRD